MDANIIKIAKSMKRNFIEITPNYICGLDASMSMFSIIYMGGDEYFIGEIGELMGKPSSIEWYIDSIKAQLTHCRNECVTISTTRTPLAVFDDLKELESFNDVLSLKSADGAKRFVLGEDYKNFIFYTFSSMHPINKSDKVSLKIYPFDDISCLTEFVIDKKKYQIHEFIRYRYL